MKLIEQISDSIRINQMRLKTIVMFLLCVYIGFSCAIGPNYSPELSLENSGLNMHDKTVVVSKFYKAQTELSYLGDLDISRILESAKLFDISYNMANRLNSEGIEAYSMKDAPANTLKEGEVMLSGVIITRSIPMEENFPFPGMLILLLVGNVLPSPAAYDSGVYLTYQYELIDSTGRILFHSPEKSSRVYYKDYYIWGRLFNYQKYEKKIRENLQNQIYDLIVDDLFR